METSIGRQLFCRTIAAKRGLCPAILYTIDLNNSTNMANTTNETQLWSWEKLPVGHFINASRKLATNPINDDDLEVVPPRSDAMS